MSEKKEVLFSIIILVFNEQKNISILLNQLRNYTQNYSTEIIIIDSGSTDNTVTKVKEKQKEFDKLRLYQIKKESFNYGSTRDLGVKLALGKYICFISGDAQIYTKNFLKHFHEDLEINKNTVAVFGQHIPYESTPLFIRLEISCKFEQLNKLTNNSGILIQNLNCQSLKHYKDKTTYLWFLSNVFSCYRRTFLINSPFGEVTTGAEDIILGKTIIDKGFTKIYDSRCIIIHSHNFNIFEYFYRQKRNYKLNFMNSETKGQTNIRCKLKKILIMKISTRKKLVYLLQMSFFYLIKLLIVIYFRLFNQKWRKSSLS